MANRKRPKAKAAYIRRLAENDYFHEQLHDAAAALSKAYRRAAKGRSQAVEDKRLYGHLREAATSIRNATGALRRQKPEPRRHARRLILISFAGGGAVLLVIRRARQKDSSEVSNSSTGDDGAGAPAPGGSSPVTAAKSPAGGEASDPTDQTKDG